MQTRLIDELIHVGRRMRTAAQLTILATIWLVFFLTAWGLSLGAPLFELSPAMMALVFLGSCIVLSILFCVISRNWFSDIRWLASRVESNYPELDSRLLTSLDQMDEMDPKKIGFLQHLVLMQTISHSAQNRWDLVVSPGKLVFSQLAAVMGFVLLLIGSIMIANGEPMPKMADMELLPADTETPTKQSQPIELVSVEPGNTEVEKGTTLTVLARFKSGMPEQAELVYEVVDGTGQDSGAGFERVAMSASFDDPVFAGQILRVNRPLTYWVEYKDQTSDRFYATVFEYPELQQLDFELDFPDYTGLPNKTINDGRRLSALIGTKVHITARLNKNVATCQLVAEQQAPIELVENGTGEPVYTATIEVEKSTRFQLKLLDKSNRENKLPPEIQINALQNKPPKIKVTKPSRDVEVSPLEELETAAKVSDDYGIESSGIAFALAGEKWNEVVLGQKMSGKIDHAVGHQLDFESLNAQPKQMVSYYFWVEDLVADGKARRVMSDMFFAEVREFEKIFRQGQSQNAQQRRQQQQRQPQNGQQQRQMGELRQLQKEIINATWKLIRRETDDEPSIQFDEDVGVIQDSQQSAISLVDRGMQQQNNVQARSIGTQIKTMMNDVILTLQKARNDESAEPLIDAVAKEQLVYQMILKLGSNENQVQRQQQQQGSNSSSSQQNRSQQQLQQLELSNNRNRYEQENQAQLRQDQQQSENRQAMNRLKELAQRQEDINKQLEQLQTALNEAKSEEEKEEIERRLKRLREQQEELLRDLDELKDQTEQNQDSELMRNANEELEKARENVRRSAEALKENQVSQAAAAGEKAQKQFEDLREDFRKNNANQFADEMKEMSDKANDLKSKQDEIADRLKQMDENPKKSLRENDERKQVAQDLIEQRKKYDSILDDIKDVVRKAEDSEPLLSQKLYDTFRDTSKSNTRDSIDTTENLLSRGFVGEARKIEETANQGIEDLNEKIQNAAESIIGDEADSLRRAEQSLRQLSEQINKEIAQNNPQAQANRDSPSKSGSEDPNKNQARRPGKASDAGNKQDATQGKDSKGQDSKSEKSRGGKSGDPKKRPDQTSKSKGQKSAGSQPGKAQKGEKGSSSGKPKNSSNQDQDRPGKSKAESKGGKPGSKGQQPGKKGAQSGKKGGRSGKSEGKQDGKPSASPGKGQGKKQGSENRQAGSKGSPNRDPIDGYERLYGSSTGGAPRPITGDEYRQFSNELRNIEELLDDPKLRARAAEIREKAKEIRVDMKRHAKKPNWDVVQEFVAEPLEKLRAEVARKLLLKENKEALVPIDRDPVPAIFEEQVQDYYRELSEVNK